MKKETVKLLNPSEFAEEKKRYQKAFFEIKISRSFGSEKNTAALKEMKRSYARLLTRQSQAQKV